jgi:hypothetical protein
MAERYHPGELWTIQTTWGLFTIAALFMAQGAWEVFNDGVGGGAWKG